MNRLKRKVLAGIVLVLSGILIGVAAKKGWIKKDQVKKSSKETAKRHDDTITWMLNGFKDKDTEL